MDLDKIGLSLITKERYLLPWSTGWAMVYHHNLANDGSYEVIYPQKFKLQLCYNQHLILLSRDERFVPWKYIEFPMRVKLEDFFKLESWKDIQIPVALNKFSLEYTVERLFSLVVFT